MGRIISMDHKAGAAISKISSLNLVITARATGAVYGDDFIIVRRRIIGRERVIVSSTGLCSGHGV